MPEAVSVDAQGNIFIADSGNHRIRKVDISGTISTIAGSGAQGYGGDGGPSTSAQVSLPFGVCAVQGNIFIADTGNHRIRKITTSGIISTVAGNGTASYNGENQPAINAMLNYPYKLAVDNVGNQFIADFSNHRVRRVWGPSTGSVTLNLTSP